MRFPVGAAGNFIASCLQCSVGVGHWNPLLEIEKPNVDWLHYFKQVFSADYDSWITNEPYNKYPLGVKEMFSSYYDRGNDLSDVQFSMAESACSQHYFNLKTADKFITIFWMKAFFPAYFENSSFIDVFLDDASLRWYDRSYYKKHYKIMKDSDGITVFNKRHSPELIPVSFKGTNQYITHFDTFNAFARQEIINNPCRQLFRSTDLFDEYSGNRPRHIMFLTDVLDVKRFIPHYIQICHMLDVDPLSHKEINSIHKHWLDCHDF